MKKAPLVIFGAGKVGCALVRQLTEAAPLHYTRDGLLFSVVAWCDSTGAALDERGLSIESLAAIEAEKTRGVPLAETAYGYAQSDLQAVVDVAGTDGCIVVDLTASDATAGALEYALRCGYQVVMANKLPLAASQATFDRLVAGGRTRYESTVGSAVPIIATARAIMRAADRVDAVRGALSGTLGFLCTGLEGGRTFSGLMLEAMQRGYTEPDPRVDLGGQDVARKALILARTLGWRLEMADVTLAALVGQETGALPLSDFLAGLPDLDASFADQVRRAVLDGKVLRYVAELRAGQVSVGLQAVSQDSALGRLRGNDNLVAFSTRCYPDEPLILQGRGAGVDAAAAGVHADLVALADGENS
jgi:homoserine dehydrogenase